MHMRRVVILLLLATARGSAEPEADDGASDASLEAQANEVTMSVAEVENVFLSFATLLRGHKNEASALFAKYNTWKDANADGDQALGTQEVRALLKDIGVGKPQALVLRGVVADAVINILDSSGDGKVSESEISPAVDVLACWMGAGPDTDGVLAPARALVASAEAAIKARTLRAASAVVDEVHAACAAPVHAWWSSSWEARSRLAEDVAFPPSGHSTSEDGCSAALIENILSVAGRDKTGTVGSKGLRTALRKHGVENVLSRHLVAHGIIGVLDTDGDRRVGAPELTDAARAVCETRAALIARGASLADAARALVLPTARGGFPLSAFATALASSSDAPAGLDAAEALRVSRQAVGEAADRPVDAVDVAIASALARTYVRLAPAAALASGAGAGKGKEEL